MPDFRVVVLELGRCSARAVLGAVDRPGKVLREVAQPRSDDLLADAAAVLALLDADALGPVLLALAVSVGADLDREPVERLRAALGDELPDGWGLPWPLPVVWGSTETWAAQGTSVQGRPVVAAAVVAAARSVGAHAHLPRGPE